MKTISLKQLPLLILGVLFISLSATSCSKSADRPGVAGVPGIKDYGTHNIDPQLQGQWMWTSGSDGGYYDQNGTWQGGQYGFAQRLAVDAKGNATLYSHIFSDLGAGSKFSVDIYYTGYCEMDEEGTLTFYSMGGRYKSSRGTDRDLAGDEIYNPSTGTGRTLTYPQVAFATVSGRPAFTTTSGGETESFFKQ